MRLHEIFRLKPGSRIAVVGSGGKTSTCIRLAESFRQDVVVTTTTHIGTSPFEGLARHFVVRTKPAVLHALEEIKAGPILLTCEKTDGTRYRGPKQEILDYVFELWRQKGFTLILEADGARELSLKAPGPHEPSIPSGIDAVIVCAGCTGIGQPMSEVMVHRPEIYASLSGLDQHQVITPEAALRVLIHPNGGLKNIPPGAGKILLLNQADTELSRIQADSMGAQAIQSGFDRAIVTSLDYKNRGFQVFSRHEPVAGIILVDEEPAHIEQSGNGVDEQGQSRVRKAAKDSLKIGLTPVVVVTGDNHERIALDMAGLPVKIVRNLDWKNGKSTSVLAGLKTLPMKTGAVVYINMELPWGGEDLLRALVEKWQTCFSSAVSPLVKYQKANPVLFDRDTFPFFASLNGNQDFKVILRKLKVEYLPWPDMSGLQVKPITWKPEV